ncbi:DUF2381 family protein [Archangium violaceum]|uniref:DUF2381 family protein n=1 Tax=Archangium violaceum TaxID=83451 RepID=UPI00194EEFC4|nr:DUF2381 family protein [Archangium violaceum]QRN97236.1 DUF2381 family protein [Archangium violaceum]
MFALSSAALVGWALLAVPTNAAAQSPLPVCEMGTRHLELTADASGKQGEVCIHPEVSTTFVFDSRVARVQLAGPERFRVVDGGTASLTLIPSEALTDGERVPVTVYFQDGAAPASATFWLVVHPFQAERLVEVLRQPRTLASYRQGEQQARAEARQCREEKARVQAECAGQMGLTGLIAHELMGEGGVASKDIGDAVTARPGNTLQFLSARSYRSPTERTERGQKVARLAVKVEVENTGTRAWTPAGAVLAGSNHVELRPLSIWPLETIPPGRTLRVVVEVEATEHEARGAFTLKLWSQEGGARVEFLDGVTFP